MTYFHQYRVPALDPALREAEQKALEAHDYTALSALAKRLEEEVEKKPETYGERLLGLAQHLSQSPASQHRLQAIEEAKRVVKLAKQGGPLQEQALTDLLTYGQAIAGQSLASASEAAITVAQYSEPGNLLHTQAVRALILHGKTLAQNSASDPAIMVTMIAATLAAPQSELEKQAVTNWGQYIAVMAEKSVMMAMAAVGSAVYHTLAVCHLPPSHALTQKAAEMTVRYGDALAKKDCEMALGSMATAAAIANPQSKTEKEATDKWAAYLETLAQTNRAAALEIAETVKTDGMVREGSLLQYEARNQVEALTERPAPKKPAPKPKAPAKRKPAAGTKRRSPASKRRPT